MQSPRFFPAVCTAAFALLTGAVLPACTKDEPEIETRAPTFENAPEPMASGMAPALLDAAGPVDSDAGEADAQCPEAACPLAAWMRGPFTRQLASGEFSALAQSFEALAAKPPPAYATWASIARDGASAARIQNREAVHAACRGCHAQFEAKYRKELRDRPL